MAKKKEYVILYTDTHLLVPVKPVYSPYDIAKKSYCATYPQFFGGTVEGGQTLVKELTEESQEKLDMGSLPVRIYPAGVGAADYVFYKSKISEIPEDIVLSHDSELPAKNREFQVILAISKADFGATKTPDKLVELCRAKNAAYCSDADGRRDWDASETKKAFEVFLREW